MNIVCIYLSIYTLYIYHFGNNVQIRYILDQCSLKTWLDIFKVIHLVSILNTKNFIPLFFFPLLSGVSELSQTQTVLLVQVFICLPVLLQKHISWQGLTFLIKLNTSSSNSQIPLMINEMFKFQYVTYALKFIGISLLYCTELHHI